MIRAGAVRTVDDKAAEWAAEVAARRESPLEAAEKLIARSSAPTAAEARAAAPPPPASSPPFPSPAPPPETPPPAWRWRPQSRWPRAARRATLVRSRR